MNGVANTFSIVGRDADEMLGVAVSSSVLAVGAHCPFVRAREVAISCQAYLHPYLAVDLLDNLHGRTDLSVAAAAALDADEGREWLQLIAIGPTGDPIAHTGRNADQWAGHRLGLDCAAAGNLLVDEEVVLAMVDAFESSSGDPLPERLVNALGAGPAVGGDRRGRQSAAMLVKLTQQIPYVDLRVDDHADPVSELGRLWRLLTPDELARNLRAATTREARPLDEIRARQESVQRTLAEQGR
jgi:uncharacterized Ntn-hydrolase superfamily protein